MIIMGLVYISFPLYVMATKPFSGSLTVTVHDELTSQRGNDGDGRAPVFVLETWGERRIVDMW